MCISACRLGKIGARFASLSYSDLSQTPKERPVHGISLSVRSIPLVIRAEITVAMKNAVLNPLQGIQDKRYSGPWKKPACDMYDPEGGEPGLEALGASGLLNGGLNCLH